MNSFPLMDSYGFIIHISYVSTVCASAALKPIMALVETRTFETLSIFNVNDVHFNEI